MQSTRATRAGPASRLLIAFASLWLACGCAAADAPAGAEAPMEKIRALIGDAACDSDAQCRTIAIGAKACGGPEAYLAWSTKRTDATALREAAAGDGTAPAAGASTPWHAVGLHARHRSGRLLRAFRQPRDRCGTESRPGMPAAQHAPGSKGPVD